LPLVLATIVCACATHDFNASKVVTLELGKSRSSGYTDRFGDPRAKRVVTTTDGKFETAAYWQVVHNFSGDCLRILKLEFRNDLFNAYVSGSSCDEDRTSVDLRAAETLKSRIDTLSATDILRILGKPSGKALCPSKLGDYKERCEKAATIWYWASMPERSVIGSGDVSATCAVISFDKDGKVLQIETDERFRSAQ
jgi:hypothetical protein